MAAQEINEYPLTSGLPAPYIHPPPPPSICGTCNALEAVGGGALLPCANCKIRLYCSRKCQKKDWSIHRATIMGPIMEQDINLDFLILNLCHGPRDRAEVGFAVAFKPFEESKEDGKYGGFLYALEDTEANRVAHQKYYPSFIDLALPSALGFPLRVLDYKTPKPLSQDRKETTKGATSSSAVILNVDNIPNIYIDILSMHPDIKSSNFGRSQLNKEAMRYYVLARPDSKPLHAKQMQALFMYCVLTLKPIRDLVTERAKGDAVDKELRDMAASRFNLLAFEIFFETISTLTPDETEEWKDVECPVEVN